MMRDYASMALGNLLHRKTRSWLTLVGIIIGIAAVVALISLGQGLSQAVTAEFLELGADKLLVTPKTVGFAVDETSNDITEQELEAVERVSGVLHTVGYNQRSAKITWSKDQIDFFPVFGFSADPVERKVVEDFNTLKLGEGRDLKQGDRFKAVIGIELTQKDTLDQPMKVGDKILVNATQFEVVGVYEKMGDPMVDTGIFISQDGYKEVFGDKKRYNALIIQTQPDVNPDTVADSVRQELRSERNLDEGDETFEVQTPQDLVDSFNTVFNIVQFVIIGIAAISLVVGGVGIMNTMYTSVLERTKEIGIMKAIGATNATVMLIFLLESGMLGLLGGTLGVLFGIFLAKLTEYIGRSVLDTLLLQAWIGWWLIAGALLFAFTVGILSGVLPARQASRQKPVDSLRYE
jgi:putative ABC transport system permease protein